VITPFLAQVVPEHLGKMHPYEHALVLVLAFGPILLLAATIVVARRREQQDDDER
jgi:hypothetical protein